MSQTSIDRLRDYLAQLSPQAQALLMREFERALERGDDVAVAGFVLEQLRQLVRGPEQDERPRIVDPARLLYRPLEPFLVEHVRAIRPGQIRRASLLPIWHWLERDAIPAEAAAFEAALASQQGNPDQAAAEQQVRALQIAAAAAIAEIATPAPGIDHHRAMARIGPPSVTEDLPAIGAILKNREALETLAGKFGSSLSAFGESQVNSIMEALKVPALQLPLLRPFALSLVMQRLVAPWQIVRLAIKVAGSDDEIRVAATSFGVSVTMAIHDLAEVAAELRAAIKRGHFGNVSTGLKTVHDGVRGLRTELDIRNDSAWGRQLAAIRIDISSSLKSEIESVPGRVRRLLRQRPDKDITAGMQLDPLEVDETAALIDFVAVCRNYAGELAINEVTLRTYSELQQYVEKATDGLVQSLRGGEARVRPFRQMQVGAAIRFCDVLFGREYASQMSRAAENAVAAAAAVRKPASRAN